MDASPTTDPLLGGLSDEQRAAVTADDGLLCVVAGAGSGKTRVLTNRVAWLAANERIDPGHALVLTFTRKAASELRQRIDALDLGEGVAAGTFHAIAYAQLRTRWNDRDIRAPRLIDRRVRLFGDGLPGADIDTVRSALAEHDWARARMIEPDQYPDVAVAHDRNPPLDTARLVTAFAAFAAAKRSRRVVDFDDLLALAKRDLEADAEYAEAMAWRFRHFFVDEFQDVNPLQLSLLESWRAGRDDLCVVGDPDQAIYSWNGADAGYLHDFDRRFGGRTMVLTDNFRSAPGVVVAANRVLDPTRPSPAAHQPLGVDPVLVGHDDDRAEADAIARAARDSHPPGTRWSTQAVLVRTHAQTAVLQEAFAAVGIPYRVRGGRSFVDHPAVVAALDLLRSSPGRLGDALPDLRAIELSDPRISDAADHLDVVVRLAFDHLRIDRDCSAASFAELLGTSVASEIIGPSGDAVDIVTFHAAKGLEWPTVHVAGLEDGYVPIWQARSREATAEELRLLYVAMTRARTTLTLHWARQRSFGEQTVERQRSPFLRVFDEIGGVDGSGEEPRADPSVRDSLRDRRAELDSSEPFRVAHDALHASLLDWRSRTARAAGVEPAAVLSDEVLDSIAVMRPTTEADLGALPGLSPIRQTRYGDTLLALVAEAGLE